MRQTTELATLGGGCFWCLEAVFQELERVKEVVSGYAGGKVANPTYRDVCNGVTGHAEVVQLAFDPARLSFQQILRVFFTVHDPTTLNRQGNDVGSQYRSAIFYHDERQKEAAEMVMKEIADAGIWENPIVTELTPLDRFYPAEDYHQNYYRQNSDQPYCQFVISPKVNKFRKLFADQAKKETTT